MGRQGYTDCYAAIPIADTAMQRYCRAVLNATKPGDLQTGCSLMKFGDIFIWEVRGRIGEL
jgi:hypothetical protein